MFFLQYPAVVSWNFDMNFPTSDTFMKQIVRLVCLNLKKYFWVMFENGFFIQPIISRIPWGPS